MTEEEKNIDDPDLSQITEYLYVSSLPKVEHAQHTFSLGIRLIISMTVSRPPIVYRQEPFQFIHCPSLDAPLIPIPQFILRRGVKAALPVIVRGDSLLVHCKEGMHRSVAMASCILITQGYTAQDAMHLIKDKRDKADPYAGHIRRQIEKFAIIWNESN